MTRESTADLVLLGGVVTMASDAATPAEAEGLAILAGEVVAIGTRTSLQSYIGEGTRVIELADAAILPGFVDSHTHLVFAGDRSAEFEARMTGQPYTAGGIRTIW